MFIPALAAAALIHGDGQVVLLIEPTLVGRPVRGQGTGYIRNQQNRGTCTMFSATAAVEWLVWRTFREKVDLSEQFTAHVGKMFWLHPEWPEIEAGGVSARENQVGGLQGGAYLPMIADGMSLPPETAMTWVHNIAYAPAITDSVWNEQWRVNLFNLSTSNLPLSALNSEFYYGVSGYHDLAEAANPDSMKGILDRGFPVVWDFDCGGDRSGSIWQVSDSEVIGSHSVLLVGYDSRAGNDRDRFFYVKNSWGATDQENGLTKISFEYLRRFGIKACYAERAIKERRPDYGYIGRWKLNFVGGKSTLDVYHKPGVMQKSFQFYDRGSMVDRRLGTLFFAENAISRSASCRVNGELSRQYLKFYYSLRNRNMAYGEPETPDMTPGVLVHFSQGQFAAGFTNSGSSTVALLGSKLAEVSGPPGSLSDLASMTGSYRLYYGSNIGTMEIVKTGSGASSVTVSATIGRLHYTGTVNRGDGNRIIPSSVFRFKSQPWVIDLNCTDKPAVGTAYERRIQIACDQSMQGLQVLSGISSGWTGFMAMKR